MDGCVESLPYRFSSEACSISDGGGTTNNSDYGCLNKRQQVQSQGFPKCIGYWLRCILEIILQGESEIVS